MSCPAWCDRAHEPGRGHLAYGPTVAGVGLLLVQPVDGPAAVRVAYPVDGRPRVLDVTPQLAADLADVLSALPPAGVEAFAAALYQVSTVLGSG